MGIFRGSRYTHTPLYNREDKLIFKMRERRLFSVEKASYHEFTEGDTLDGLALKYYGDSQLWWAILEANTQYRSELEIPYGAELAIPDYGEVVG